MKKLIDKYPVGTRLEVVYNGKHFGGIVIKSPDGSGREWANIDIIPDIKLSHGRFKEYGIHSVQKDDIIGAVYPQSFEDSLFTID